MANDPIPVEADAVWDENPNRVRRNAVQAMLSEQRNLLDQQPKTWTDRDKVRTPVGKPVMKDKLKRSGFDARLAYMGPFLGYWIQNRQIWKGQTTRVKLADVPEVAFDVKGEKVMLRAIVRKAFEVFDEDILRSEPRRCKFCVEYVARTDMELMAHISKHHPEELKQFADAIEKMREDEENEAEPEPAAPPPRPRQTHSGKYGA